MNKYSLFYCASLLIITGCSSINDYGTNEIHWGLYGNAWRCDVMYINKSADGSTGALNDATDLVTKPVQLALNTATLRFLWGTNGVGNYLCEFISILPGYSHCDAAFWYDFGLKSLDIEEPSTEE